MELKGKVVNFLGDSITEGHGVLDKENRYDNLLKAWCGLEKVNNYGVSGTRIAHQFTPSAKARHDLDFCGRAYDMDPDADLIIVFGGTNDYGHGDAPFGKVGDITRMTFCGSVAYLCRTIRELYPKAVPVFIAPAHRLGDREAPHSEERPKSAVEQRPLKDYVNAIMEIASSYGFHTLSFYDSLGLDPNDREVLECYIPDGLHFNDQGHHVMAKCLKAFLESI